MNREQRGAAGSARANDSSRGRPAGFGRPGCGLDAGGRRRRPRANADDLSPLWRRAGAAGRRGEPLSGELPPGEANAAARKDPVNDLRRGWDLLSSSGSRIPASTHCSMARRGRTIGRQRPRKARPCCASWSNGSPGQDACGWIRTGAVQMIHSACRGVTLDLISTPTAERDQGLSAATREAVLTAITIDASRRRKTRIDPRARHAVALKAALGEPSGFTPAETGLLVEWLDRLSGETRRRAES